MSKSVAIYARQSNIEDGNLARQIRECKLFIRDRADWELSQVIEDKGTGQSRLFDRSNGRQLADIIQSGSVDIILASSLDRFTRDRNGSEDLKSVRNLITAKGLELWFVKEGQIDNTWGSDKVLMTGSIASHDFVRSVRDNTLGGKYTLLDEGSPVWAGRTLYGYKKTYNSGRAKNQNSVVTIDPSQAAIVEQVFTRFASGENAKTIAEDLNTNGIPSPDAIKLAEENKDRSRDPRPWSPAQIKNMVTKPLYRGWYTFGKFETVTLTHWLDEEKTIPDIDDKGSQRVTKTRRQRPEEDKNLTWFEFPLEDLRIVSDDIWEQCKRMLSQNKRTVRRSVSPYLLTGRVFCHPCGAHYKGSSRKTKTGHTRYYRHTCECGYLHRAEDLEDKVWGIVLNFVYSDDSIRGAIERIEAGDPTKTARINNDLGKLEALLEDKSREIKTTVRTIPQLPEGLAVTETVKLLERLEAERLVLEAKRGQLLLELETVKLDETQVLDMMSKIRAIAENATPEKQKQIVNLLDLKVRLLPPVWEKNEDNEYTQVKGYYAPEVDITLLDNVVQSPINS